MLPRTFFLGRLIGLFLILAALSMLMHKQSLVATVPRLIQDRPLLLFIGLIASIAGLAMVLGHNVWAGGTLPVVVTPHRMDNPDPWSAPALPFTGNAGDFFRDVAFRRPFLRLCRHFRSHWTVPDLCRVQSLAAVK